MADIGRGAGDFQLVRREIAHDFQRDFRHADRFFGVAGMPVNFGHIAENQLQALKHLSVFARLHVALFQEQFGEAVQALRKKPFRFVELCLPVKRVADEIIGAIEPEIFAEIVKNFFRFLQRRNRLVEHFQQRFRLPARKPEMPQ